MEKIQNLRTVFYEKYGKEEWNKFIKDIFPLREFQSMLWLDIYKRIQKKVRDYGYLPECIIWTANIAEMYLARMCAGDVRRVEVHQYNAHGIGLEWQN